MLSRDSVKRRMDSDQGISFLEFSYQLFQVRGELLGGATQPCMHSKRHT